MRFSSSSVTKYFEPRHPQKSVPQKTFKFRPKYAKFVPQKLMPHSFRIPTLSFFEDKMTGDRGQNHPSFKLMIKSEISKERKLIVTVCEKV